MAIRESHKFARMECVGPGRVSSALVLIREIGA